jgi:hypothetical protein
MVAVNIYCGCGVPRVLLLKSEIVSSDLKKFQSLKVPRYIAY